MIAPPGVEDAHNINMSVLTNRYGEGADASFYTVF